MALLPRVITTFASSDVTTLGSVSPGKLAFRLRLVGGAVRTVTCENIAAALPALIPLLAPELLHHTEKPVRKAAAKLLKVCLLCGRFYVN